MESQVLEDYGGMLSPRFLYNPLAHDVEGVLVVVECKCRLRHVAFRGVLPYRDDDPARNDGQRAETPRQVAQHRAMPFTQRQLEDYRPLAAPAREGDAH